MFRISRLIFGVLFLWLGVSGLIWGEVEKVYGRESGRIHYDISGGGILAEGVELTVRGQGKLQFRESGSIALVEESIEEITHGVLHDIHRTTTCYKRENGQRMDLDYKTQKVMENSAPQREISKEPLEGFTRNGEMEIAGYKCKVWEYKRDRKCLYQGIPLLIEKNILNMHYAKKAVEVTFDINTSTEQCTVPEIPVQKFALFKAGKKTKTQKMPKIYLKILSEVSNEVYHYVEENNTTEETIPEKLKFEWIEKIGQNLFEKQKERLPKLLDIMQKSRVCLTKAQSLQLANKCIVDLVKIKGKMIKDKNNTIELWNEEEREKLLLVFDDNIALMEQKMVCVRSAKNVADLAGCMK